MLSVPKCNLLKENQVCADIEILRDVQISIFSKIFQISNRYLQPIASSVSVSNHGPEKCGFGQIKGANP
jgi:hypothetical protein